MDFHCRPRGCQRAEVDFSLLKPCPAHGRFHATRFSWKTRALGPTCRQLGSYDKVALGPGKRRNHPCRFQVSDYAGAFDRSMQHHLRNDLLKDGVAMSQQRRSRFSSTQITDVWRRWKAGQSLHEIGRAYGKPILLSDVYCCPVAVSLLLFVAARG